MKKQPTTITQLKNHYNGYFFTAILSFLLLLLVLFSSTQALAGKTYKMKKVSIVADLAADGSMTVAEERTYRFKGRFKYAFRTFPLDSRISYENFQVLENGQPYQLSDSQEPGTYTVTTTNTETEVRWYYQSRNETRTFKLEYQVNDAVKRHLDGAVLYYQFIGDDFRKSTQQVDITVNPPVTVDQWKIRQWAHGPLWGNSATSDQGVVSATCENLPKKQFFELRVLYPAEIFSEAPQISGYIAGEVTTEENAWAEEANLRREEARNDAAALEKRQKIGLWALPLLVALAAAWFFRIAIQYGTRPTVPAVASSSAEIPSNLPPALVGYLIGERAVGPSAMMATLMDLARRGFLEFREEHELGKNFLGHEKWKTKHSWLLKNLHYREHRHSLAEFEDMLIKFVFEDLADAKTNGSAMVIVDLETFKKKKSKVQKFFSLWSKKVKSEAVGYDFFDQESFRGRNQGMTLGAIMLVLAIPMIPVVHALAIIPAVAGIIMIIGANGIVHHTSEGLIQEKQWKSLKTWLKKQGFKSAEPDSVLEFIEPYFIYGVIMGMSKNQLEGLGALIPANQGLHYMPWYHHNQHEGGLAGGDFGASFSTAVASVNSAMSSSTGAGGGASGGGGGGAGGGGGGAG